ncbi:MAG: aminotransferase class V-fold PLP-dependent enzyme, partial [Candidatus Parcubacteria bacterium]|nr:aminotransferase class V-fold PLP-dependent enzyme [Candidatus Parcubacteria bacterium]
EIQKIKNIEIKRLTKLQNYFLAKLQHSDILKNVRMLINGDLENRLPNNINVSFLKIPSDLLVIELSERGIMASAKSACESSQVGGSYVIKALRGDVDGEEGGVRFSFGKQTNKKDIDYTIKSLSLILTKLKKWYD